MKFDDFVPRFVAAHQFNATALAIQPFSQQSKQRLICRRVHARGKDLDFQFIAKRRANFIFGSARLELHRK